MFMVLAAPGRMDLTNRALVSAQCRLRRCGVAPMMWAKISMATVPITVPVR